MRRPHQDDAERSQTYQIYGAALAIDNQEASPVRVSHLQDLPALSHLQGIPILNRLAGTTATNQVGHLRGDPCR